MVTNNIPATKSICFIGTHDGKFHCDEALACGLLRHTKLGRNATIVRTRDVDKLNLCTVVVDVGAIYDYDKLRFDHHQKEFNEIMQIGIETYKTKLSSAGLIFKHFGAEIITNYYNEYIKSSNLSVSSLTESKIITILQYYNIYILILLNISMV